MKHSFYKATAKHVDTLRVKLPINRPLVALHPAPPGGWAVTVEIHGVPTLIPGAHPNEVFKNAENLVKNNNLDVSSWDIWATLNFHWLSGSLENCRMADPQDLIKILEGKNIYSPVAPSEWIPQALSWMGFYLACEKFSSASFQEFAYEWTRMTEPKTNFSLGNPRLYGVARQFFLSLKNNPAYERKEARERFLELLSHLHLGFACDVPTTYASAAKTYHWR